LFFFFLFLIIFLLLLLIFLLLVPFPSSFHSRTGYQAQNTVQKVNMFSVVNSDPQDRSSRRVHRVALYVPLH
jgi:hypothetical protein